MIDKELEHEERFFQRRLSQNIKRIKKQKNEYTAIEKWNYLKKKSKPILLPF